MLLMALPSTCATIFVLRAGMQPGLAAEQDVTTSGALAAHSAVSQYVSHGGKAVRLLSGSVLAATVAATYAANINPRMRYERLACASALQSHALRTGFNRQRLVAADEYRCTRIAMFDPVCFMMPSCRQPRPYRAERCVANNAFCSPLRPPAKHEFWRMLIA